MCPAASNLPLNQSDVTEQTAQEIKINNQTNETEETISYQNQTETLEPSNKPSIVKTNMIATISSERILKKIGRINDDTLSTPKTPDQTPKIELCFFISSFFIS